MASIEIWSKLHENQHLRPKTRSVVAGDIRQNENKALLGLEIRQTRKKSRRLGPLQADIWSKFREIQRGLVAEFEQVLDHHCKRIALKSHDYGDRRAVARDKMIEKSPEPREPGFGQRRLSCATGAGFARPVQSDE
jgi:hypothetical protein